MTLEKGDTGERLKLRQIDKRGLYVSKHLLLTCKKIKK